MLRAVLVPRRQVNSTMSEEEFDTEELDELDESELEDLDDLETLDDDLDTDLDDDDLDEDDGDTDDGDDDDDDPEALDELEAEEREMLTEDESDETIVVDEAAEMRAIRRAEIALEDNSADTAGSEEFVCTVCFLVKNRTQLASPRKRICKDCAE